MLTRKNQNITWDAENRPVSISQNGTTAYFIYDGDGNRVKKTEGGQTVLYVNKYYEVNLTTNNNTSYYYLATTLIAQKKGDVLTYVHADHLSGASLMSDVSGNSLGTIKYEPFGSTRSITGAIPTDKLFTGQRLDGTGLYYFKARYYDPNIGRFLSPDSIMADLYDPQSLNRYSYVLNSPLRYNDPTGNWPSFKAIGNTISNSVQTAVNTVKQNMDIVHTVLDVAGMIPVVGEAFDAVNGVIYAVQGDYVNAALSLAACIPVVGSVATGAKLTAKVVDKVHDVVKAADNADDIKLLYHYTNADPNSILKSGLKKGESGNVYTTPDGTMSPMEAKQKLALPDPVPPRHLFGVDVKKLQNEGYNIPKPTIVQRAFDNAGTYLPGGGLEVILPYNVPESCLIYFY
jgi:RHS repeat-associated protein